MIEIIAVNGVPVNAGNKILDRIGEPAALEQLAEEATELAKAALKLARVERGNNPTPVTKEQALENLQEEISDVHVCCSVLGIASDDGIRAAKLKRWLERLGVEYEIQEC